MKKWTVFLLLVLTVAWTVPTHAELSLPSIIGENMVLQRDQPLPIWGWDEPGTNVKATLGEQTKSATAGANGKWRVTFDALPAGGPYELAIKGTTEVSLKNILVGEVWLCSGQSNMEWSVAKSDNAEKEIASANHARIRHIKISRTPSKTPQKNVSSTSWQLASPETAGQFTAVGYFFARHLQQELDVPIGLIGSNWGGTRIEPWTPPTGFQQVGTLSDIEADLENLPASLPNGKINHQSPLALYNGMIHPLVPYAIRGAIWYQGESNNGEGMVYHEKMKALIQGWRTVWNNDSLPFYFVQLAPFRYRGDASTLPGIWEAQVATLAVPHTGMAVTVDIGNVTDIHPRNKQDVGKRLALWALAKNYGRDSLVYSGPLYKSMKVEGNKVRIQFNYVADGLKSRDKQPLSWFTISGQNKEFVEAKAEIDGNDVLVWADSVSKPVAVRFGWNQEAEPNLSNSSGLPASPFRTDDW